MEIRKLGNYLGNYPAKSPQFSHLSSVLESLKYRRYEKRVEQERKRVILFYYTFHYFVKTYFGKGYFDWRDTYGIYERGFELLAEYPKSSYLRSVIQEVDHPLNGPMVELKPGKTIYDFIAEPNDPNPVLEGKRIAILYCLQNTCKLMVMGGERHPSYRERYNPNVETSIDGYFSKTFPRDLIVDATAQDKGVLKTHQPYCPPKLWQTYEEYVLKYDTPFNVEI